MTTSSPELERPLPKEGVADCPSCGSKQTVKRHNADWTCYKCWFHETVDEDRELEREISDKLFGCAEWFGRNPSVKAYPMAWSHLLTYAPTREAEYRRALLLLREGLSEAKNTNLVDYIDAVLATK